MQTQKNWQGKDKLQLHARAAHHSCSQSRCLRGRAVSSVLQPQEFAALGMDTDSVSTVPHASWWSWEAPAVRCVEREKEMEAAKDLLKVPDCLWHSLKPISLA